MTDNNRDQLATYRSVMSQELAFRNGIEPLAPGSPDGKVFITCARCDMPHMIIVSVDDYTRWTTRRTVAREAFRDLAEGSLTLLETGLCQRCFDVMWTEKVHDLTVEAQDYDDGI